MLDSVDLKLPPGTTLSITGENGAGKTTLLRVVAGLIKPDRGTVVLNGLDSEEDARGYRARVSVLSAGNTGLFARLSVYHHLEYVARLAFVPRGEIEQTIARMLDAFALRELVYKRVDRLSMGQRQRVRAALTFLPEPGLALLDEPQTSLDDEGVSLLGEVLRGYLARGGAVLWCSPAGVREEGEFDQRLVLKDGRLTPT